MGESTEGSNNRRTSPRRRPVAYKPPGKATKRPSPQADPVTTSEEDIVLEGPISLGEKKAAPSKPPSPLKTKLCHTCGKACPRLKARNKHIEKVHLGTPVASRWGPKRYKTRSNRKKQENKSGISGHSPAGVSRRTYAPAPKPKFPQSGPRSPGPGDGED